MKDYHINIFYSQADEAYVADIPDLEACSALGGTTQEALREFRPPRIQPWQRRRLVRVLSGRNIVTMDDGREIELKQRDFFALGPGHDSRVLGDGCGWAPAQGGRSTEVPPPPPPA